MRKYQKVPFELLMHQAQEDPENAQLSAELDMRVLEWGEQFEYIDEPPRVQRQPWDEDPWE